MLARKLTTWIITAGLVLFLHALAFGQAVNNGQIHGVVQDPSGAVVPGAQIQATSVSTGTVRSTVSGADGSFVIPDLQVGQYSLEVTAAGFSKYKQTGIVLQVGQNVQVNIGLKVGSASQEVQVSADAAMVETQDTSISEVMDQQRIVDLPLNGRQATDLILLSGGAAMPPNAASRVVTTHDYVNSVGVSVSGGQINGNNYLLDGGDNNDSHSNINMPFPFPDALQEYSVQTNGISARYGLHPGSVINVVTKQGGSSYHGDLFEFVRTPSLNAQNRFSTASSHDALHRNQFGGTIGGPIIRNKLFGFGGYQGTIIHNVSGSNVVNVATQAMLNGNWTACSGKTLVLNPNTYVAPALAYMKLIPVSTDPCGKLTFPASNPSNEYQDVGRFDWVRTPKNTIYGRYFILDYSNPAVYTSNLLTLTRPSLLDRSQSLTVGNQMSLSSTVINAMHFTYSRLAIHRSDPSSMPSPKSVGINIYDGSPNFSYIQLSNYFTIGGGSNAPAKFVRNQYQWADDTDWIRSKQHFSFGAEGIVGQMYQNNIYDANGFFNFNGQGTGDALGDFLTGNVFQFTDTGQQVSNSYGKYLAAYFEDDVQLTKKLNVHAGVRWEPSLPETQQYNEGDHIDFGAFAAGTRSTVFTNAPPGVFFYGDKGIPKAYANGSYDDFAPRIGFAWDPTGRGMMSIRSSYGIFFDQPETFTDSAFSLAPPWANGLTLTTPAGGLANPYQGVAGGNPFPNPFPPKSNAGFNQNGTYVNLPLGLHHPYMQQYDLSLERQFGNDWSVTISYVGNKATHLRSGYEENAPQYAAGATTKNETQRRILYETNPANGIYYSTITMMNDGVNTNYNALQASARHRLSHGYTLLFNYTYSHCLQDTETIGNKLQGNTQTNPNNMRFDYGPCDFDLRQNTNVSFVYQGYKFANPTMNLIAGGWSPSFLVSYNNGYPFSPLTGTDASLTGIGLDRPNAVAGVSPYLKGSATSKGIPWLNSKAFVSNGPGTFGTTGMNSLLGPHYIDSDVSIRKLFRTFHEQNLELRWEFFNIFNHPNLSTPVNSFTNSSFGYVQAANPPRIMQIAGKYTF
ncbi:MAG TPA: carboxypeptidase regulatory-like domain-containing protein [Terracidiphilus sp.]|nr:carboxypeptidase regulatory-like domain-containing protein [Terracidiphilus sp.]